MSLESAAKKDEAKDGKAKVTSEKKATKVVKNRAGLANGRPPSATKPPATLSHHKTRATINQHHQFNKQLVAAEAKGDESEIAELKKQIEDLGGLKGYQLASIQGQSKDRGGDSSIVLMEWLKPLAAEMSKREQKIRLLEVGALSTSNACSKSGLFDIERIDLFSQAEGILQQDFMER